MPLTFKRVLYRCTSQKKFKRQIFGLNPTPPESNPICFFQILRWGGGSHQNASKHVFWLMQPQGSLGQAQKVSLGPFCCFWVKWSGVVLLKGIHFSQFKFLPVLILNQSKSFVQSFKVHSSHPTYSYIIDWETYGWCRKTFLKCTLHNFFAISQLVLRVEEYNNSENMIDQISYC